MERDLALVLPHTGAIQAEANLVDRLKARSDEAWAGLYDAHYKKLYRYAVARLGSGDLAEDVVATVFQRALTAIDAYSYREKPLLAWLYRIARNVISEHQRASLRWNLVSLFRTWPSGPNGVLGTSSPETAMIQPRASRNSEPEAIIGRLDLLDAVTKLTADQREVVLLRYFGGLSAQEAAKALGKQERSVYSLQTRAVEALRRHLG